MVELYRNFDHPLEETTLFRWHGLLMQGRHDVKDVGCYRAHADPMQVVSGPLHELHVHFEAPPSDQMAFEMTRFVDWFAHSAPGGTRPLAPLARAGIAHLYFVSIHPFEDGNGRLARALSEKCLAQGLGQPSLTALSVMMQQKRKQYYSVLERANKQCDATEWLLWFGEIARAAQQRTEGWIDFLIAKTRLLDRLRGRLNERQEKALLRMLHEGPEGFKGGLSAGNYVTITGTTPATATRDLASLVTLGALTRTGELKGTRYWLVFIKTSRNIPAAPSPSLPRRSGRVRLA